MGNKLIELPKPKTIEKLEGHYNIKYGPAAITSNRIMAASLGSVIASIAEAERHLEALLKSIAGGHSRIMTALLANFRGHKQLLGAVELALEESENGENSKTFATIRPQIYAAWEMRDGLAHAIWATSSQHPDAAIKISPRVHGRAEQRFKEALFAGDFETLSQAQRAFDGEIWNASDFIQAARAADGVVNSLMAFSVCIGRSPEEAEMLHLALRNQGLLSSPPWKLLNSTRPPETDSTH